MSALQISLPDQAATATLADRIGGLLRSGDAVLLAGDLGAGKTTFARALLRCVAGDPTLEVPSPTFTLQQSYETARGTVHHFDLWRLGDASELTELGWEEALRAIVVVEWPERLGVWAPAGALTISLAIAGESARVATLSGWPDRLGALR